MHLRLLAAGAGDGHRLFHLPDEPVPALDPAVDDGDDGALAPRPAPGPVAVDPLRPRRLQPHGIERIGRQAPGGELLVVLGVRGLRHCQEPQRRNSTIRPPRSPHVLTPPSTTGRASTPFAVRIEAAIAARAPLSQMVTTGRSLGTSAPATGSRR